MQQVSEWLRACSSWLLSNDLDMKMPGGVLDTDPLDLADDLDALIQPNTPERANVLDVDDETKAEIENAEKAKIIAWLRHQSDLGADIGIAADKGSTRRAAFGGGSLALKRAADAIEADEHLDCALSASPPEVVHRP